VSVEGTTLLPSALGRDQPLAITFNSHASFAVGGRVQAERPGHRRLECSEQKTAILLQFDLDRLNINS
jgi:hypothetical protein